MTKTSTTPIQLVNDHILPVYRRQATQLVAAAVAAATGLKWDHSLMNFCD